MIAIKPVLIVLFWTMTIYGAFQVVKGMRQIRTARKYKEFIFAWSERPVSAIKYDTLSWLAISIHWIAVVVIGLVEALVLVVRPLPVSVSSLWVFLILGGIIPVVGYIWGTGIFNPIAGFLGGNRNYAIANEGILLAGNLIPWNAFTHFSFERENNIIRLWSSTFHGLVALLFAPSEEHLAKVLDTLQNHLPDENTVSTPGLMWQLAFPLLMAAGCCLLILIAIPITLLLSTEVVLVVNGVLMYVLMLIGGPLLLWALFGGKMRPAAVEPQQDR